MDDAEQKGQGGGILASGGRAARRLRWRAASSGGSIGDAGPRVV